MVIIDRAVTGAAVRTISQTGMTPTTPGIGGTITVDDASGWPSSGKFEVVVDRGEVNEESILMSSRSGPTFTIGQRGYDGTVASTHTAAVATVELDLSATLIQLLINHVDDVEADPHSTKLLNNTRHDVEARHQFGAGAFGTPVTPTALTPDIAGAAGSGNNPAREDHVHNVPAATAVSVGVANAEGSSGSFARADHVHDIGNAAIDDPALFATGIRPYYTQAGDPGAVGNGILWFDTTNRLLKIRNAGNSAWDLYSEVIVPWTTYAPTLGGVTLGGGTSFGRYTRMGDTVVGVAGFELGGAGNVTAGITVSLPLAAADIGGMAERHHAGARAVDSSAGNVQYAGIGAIRPETDPNIIVGIATAGTTGWAATVPFDWASGDDFSLFFEYEAA